MKVCKLHCSLLAVFKITSHLNICWLVKALEQFVFVPVYFS